MKNDIFTETLTFDSFEYEKIKAELEKYNLSFSEYARDAILKKLDLSTLVYLELTDDIEIVGTIQQDIPTSLNNDIRVEKVALSDFIKSSMYEFGYENSKEISQEILHNSYDFAVKKIENSNLQILFKDKLFEKEITRQINEEYTVYFEKLFISTLTNKYLKDNHHFFASLYKGQTIYYDINNKPYFNKLANALATGYVQQEFLKSLDTNRIKILKHINNNGVTGSEEVLKFLKNKKYQDYLTALIVGKEIGMTTRNSMQYRKKLYTPSIDEKSHTNVFVNFKTISFEQTISIIKTILSSFN